ncbi:MAG: sugar phosphate isomerase/epimerase [Planctomycetes bacterium]|nr:sugar phosphate isomerase/epimerase [Planctomycetota bacterium]
MAASAAGLTLGPLPQLRAQTPVQRAEALAREVGITTSSLDRHVSATGGNGLIALLDLPKFMRDELDMRLIDLNTRTLGSLEPDHVERLRAAADRAGCAITNLKMNQNDLDMNSPDEPTRKRAIDTYKACIDAAARLGARWARPLPGMTRPDMQLHVAGYRELADYGASRKIQMLVENYRWMQTDPGSVAELIQAIDRDVAASPDIGNWSDNSVRYAGLEKTFPLAVTCDFKARELAPNGEHPLYDLRRCFEIGWKSGFRGPWCLEHAHTDRRTLIRELCLLRDMLRGWMKDL